MVTTAAAAAAVLGLYSGPISPNSRACSRRWRCNVSVTSDGCWVQGVAPNRIKVGKVSSKQANSPMHCFAHCSAPNIMG